MEKIITPKSDGKIDSIHSFGEALTSARENIGPSIKHALSDSADRLSEYADEAKKVAFEKSREASSAVSRSMRSQPWTYLAGASLVGLALGMYLGRRK